MKHTITSVYVRSNVRLYKFIHGKIKMDEIIYVYSSSSEGEGEGEGSPVEGEDSITSDSITNKKMIELLGKVETYSYDSEEKVMGEAHERFWGIGEAERSDEKYMDSIRAIEIFKTSDGRGFGVRVKAGAVVNKLWLLNKNGTFGYYGGLVVPINCGWNTCGKDRTIIVKVYRRTFREQCDKGTWVMPYSIYGEKLREHFESKGGKNRWDLVEIDGHVNGNWMQFLNSPSVNARGKGKKTQANCIFSENGQIRMNSTVNRIVGGDNGKELLINYYDPKFNTYDAQAYIKSQNVISPSVRDVVKFPGTVWIYPGRQHVKDHEGNILNLYKSEIEIIVQGQGAVVVDRIKATNEDEFPGMNVPMIEKDWDGVPYIPINVKPIQKDAQMHVLKWNEEVIKVSTECEVTNKRSAGWSSDKKEQKKKIGLPPTTTSVVDHGRSFFLID